MHWQFWIIYKGQRLNLGQFFSDLKNAEEKSSHILSDSQKTVKEIYCRFFVIHKRLRHILSDLSLRFIKAEIKSADNYIWFTKSTTNDTNDTNVPLAMLSDS